MAANRDDSVLGKRGGEYIFDPALSSVAQENICISAYLNLSTQAGVVR